MKLEKKSLTIKLDNRSKHLRKLVLECLIGGDRGHMGSAMSLIEILRVLYDKVLKFDPKNPNFSNRDRLILSKGHGCLALYAILSEKGFFSKNVLKTSSRYNSILGGHPEFDKVPGVEASTGALGHGAPLGLGIAIGARIEKKKFHTYVVVGDGEINEGSFWEASMIARKHKLSNYHIIIDYNKIQSYGKTKDVLELEPLQDKLSAFGYKVNEVNGHDINQLSSYFKKNKKNNKPSALICHTIKGKGFYFAEQNPYWHHKNFFTNQEKKQLIECLKN